MDLYFKILVKNTLTAIKILTSITAGLSIILLIAYFATLFENAFVRYAVIGISALAVVVLGISYLDYRVEKERLEIKSRM